MDASPKTLRECQSMSVTADTNDTNAAKLADDNKQIALALICAEIAAHINGETMKKSLSDHAFATDDDLKFEELRVSVSSLCNAARTARRSSANRTSSRSR